MPNKFNYIILAFIISFLFNAPINAYAETISAERSAELRNLLIQDCGSCHGMTLKGGLGPALTPDVLKNKSREMIEMTITHGRPGTPMPPWNTILTKQEINWLIDTLYAGVKHE